MPGRAPVHVLWTGGWDSTFRVLDLALREGKRVQPHYILDPGRVSTMYELRAVDQIRLAANRRCGEDRIGEPRRIHLDEIIVADRIREAQQELAARHHIGDQYAYLVAYAEQYRLDSLELCVHVDDRAYALAKAGSSLSEDEHNDANARGVGSYLSRFAFPVLELSKTDMLRAAQHCGFADLMALSWFCHLPTASGRPCGFCRPCRWTVSEGLPYRVSRAGHICAVIDSLAQRVPSMRARRAIRSVLRQLR